MHMMRLPLHEVYVKFFSISAIPLFKEEGEGRERSQLLCDQDVKIFFWRTSLRAGLEKRSS